jgi:hypothetical protein
VHAASATRGGIVFEAILVMVQFGSVLLIHRLSLT